MGSCDTFAGVMGASSAATFHSISTNDPVFASLGLSVFTMGEFLEVMNKEKKIFGFFKPKSVGGNSLDFLNYDILGGDGTGSTYTPNGSPAIYKWDPTLVRHRFTKLSEYNIQSNPSSQGGQPSQLHDAIVYNSQVIQNNIPGAPVYIQSIKDYIHDIKASESGCVTWGVKLWYNPEADGMHVGIAGGTSCIKQFYPKFKLHLYDDQRRRKNKRRAITRGRPVFAAVPETADGMPYSFGDTDQAPSPGYNNFKSVSEGAEDNPSNTVAAEIDVFYNSTTGKWEGGTRSILARMITDMPAVVMNEFKQAEVDDYALGDNYTPEAKNFTGFYNDGWACPMSVHKGNPNLFGPVLKNTDCSNKPVKRKLKVINRSPTDFFEGDLVMLTRITNEWIAQEFRKTQTGEAFSFGVQGWSFTSFISNSDSYFKDAMYYYEGNTMTGVSTLPQPPSGPQWGATLSPTSYESDFRGYYYGTMLNYPVPACRASLMQDGDLSFVNNFLNIAAINLGFAAWSADGDLNGAMSGVSHASTIPNTRSADRNHIQITSFDFLNEHLGGINRYGNVIGRTNPYIRPDNTDIPEGDREKYYSFYPFFGPIFTDGYRQDDGGDLHLASPQNINPHGFYGSHFIASYGAGTLPHSITKDCQAYGGPFSYTQAVGQGPNLGKQWIQSPGVTATNLKMAKQLPADVMLNASPIGSRNGGPIENLEHTQFYARIDPNKHAMLMMAGFFQRITASGLVSTPTYIPGIGHQKRWQWVGTTGPENDSKDYYKSYYDKKPANDRSITFMPLMAEVVGSFDTYGSERDESKRAKVYRSGRNFFGHSRDNIPGGGSNGINIPRPDIGSAGGFGASFLPVEQMVGRVSPATNGWVGGGNLDFTIPPGYSSGPNVIADSFTNWGIPYDEWVYHPAPNAYALIGANWWVGTPRGGGGGGACSECVGVITAKCKVNIKANQIVLKTDSFIGTSQAGGTSGGSSGSTFSFFFGLGGWSSSDPTSTKDPQWGSLTDKYSAFGTTALWARCFEQWPNDQTMFDPRYFAVKHFNPGIHTDTVRYSTITKDANGNDLPEMGTVPANIWNNGDPYKRLVDIVSYTTDFRIPTFAAFKVTTTGPTFGQIDGFFDNVVVGTNVMIGSNISLRDKDEGRINPVCRGMCVPFKYYRRTIGVWGPDNFWTFYPLHYSVSPTQADVVNNDSDPDTGQISAGPNNPDCGFGFKVGDLLGAYGGHGEGVTLKVIATEHNKVNGKSGAIKFNNTKGMFAGLEYTTTNGIPNRGYSYHSTDFADLSLIAPNFDAGGRVKLGVKTGSGKNLTAYVRIGQVYEKAEENAGPKELGVAQRLSISSNNGQGTERSSGGGTTGRSIGQFQGSFEAEGIEKFDLFFHFHNDIGHTMMGADVARFDQYQNSIQLNISTL